MFSWHPPLCFSSLKTTNQPPPAPVMGGPDIAHQGQIIASGELDRFTEGQKPGALQLRAVGTGAMSRWDRVIYKMKKILHKMLCKVLCKLVDKFMRGMCLIKWKFIQY